MFMSNRTLTATAGVSKGFMSPAPALQQIYWPTELEVSGGLGHTKTGRDRDRALYFPA
jgi:hypothetical protein